MGFEDGHPLVIFSENRSSSAIKARSLTPLTASDIGAQAALLFEGNDWSRPLIVGRILNPSSEIHNIVRDGSLVRIDATERIELRVGKAAIILEKDGHITVRGSHLVSQATGSNRIRGGSVDLN